MYFRPQCNHFILLLKSYTGLFKGLCIEGLVYDLKNKYEKKKKNKYDQQCDFILIELLPKSVLIAHSVYDGILLQVIYSQIAFPFLCFFLWFAFESVYRPPEDRQEKGKMILLLIISGYVYVLFQE